MFFPNSFSSACLDPLLPHLWQQRWHSPVSRELGDKHQQKSVCSLDVILHELCWADRKCQRPQLPIRVHGSGQHSTEAMILMAPGCIPQSCSQGAGKVVHCSGKDVNTLVVHHGLKDMLLISMMDGVKSLVR